MFKNYQLISRRLSKIFIIAAILYPIFILLTWCFINSDFMRILTGIDGIKIFDLVSTPAGSIDLLKIHHSYRSKMIGCAGSFMSAIPYIFCYYMLSKVFKNYSLNKIFIVENVATYKKIGLAIFVNGLISIPLRDCFFVLSATLNNPPGQRLLSIGFGTPNLEAIIAGFVVMVISWVMQQGHYLQQEQQLTI